jgi:2-polyprenyl-3-methyl-5-hydroxy-6-metoxy-1,4-benzoquinol methylase
MTDADGNEHEPDPSKLYQKCYHKDGVAPKMMAAWRVIAIVLIEHFRPVNVIDFGCSGGGLVRQLCSLGVDAIGIDGSGPAAEITPGKILTHDLRIADGIPWSPGAFDLAVSSDVLEHIEQQYDNVEVAGRVQRPADLSSRRRAMMNRTTTSHLVAPSGGGEEAQ